jgi:predicted ester cyclase
MSTMRTAFDRAIANWNAGDLDGYLELYDDGIRLHGYSEAPMDKASVAAFYRGIHDAVHASRIEIHDVMEDGDKLCARFTMSGVHGGELAGVAATGKPISQDGMTILRFDGDKCVERWSVADMLAVLVQIGAVLG